MTSLDTLQPGQVLEYDYRSVEAIKTAKLGESVRIVQWNIERGVKLEGIIATLMACDADIVVLQELDINCRRSGYVNVPEQLAQALHAQVLFVCEFDELDAPERSEHNAVGPFTASDGQSASQPSSPPPPPAAATTKKHFHGNAILSRCVSLRDATVIRHATGLDWDVKGNDVAEPRHGFRSVLRVLVSPLDRQPRTLPPLYLYCCHLEVFCGALMRVRQLADCLRDAQALLSKAKAGAADDHALPPSHAPLPAFVIAGDMNTMAHGVVRFSPKYATDRLRLLSLGETEACWWQRKVLARGMGAVTRGCCPFSYRFPFFMLSHAYEWLFNNRVVWRLLYGFSLSEQRALDNSAVCFYDPADKFSSITLDNPDYKGFVRGKLDWLLLSNLTPVSLDVAPLQALVEQGSLTDKATVRALHTTPSSTVDSRDGYVLFNDTYRDSDHKGLLVCVKQNAVGGPEDVYPAYGAVYTRSFYALGAFFLSRALPLGLVALVVYRAKLAA